MKQLRRLTPVVFLSVLPFLLMGCSNLRRNRDVEYCYSGVDTCKCGKAKPPGYVPDHLKPDGYVTSEKYIPLNGSTTALAKAPGPSIQVAGITTDYSQTQTNSTISTKNASDTVQQKVADASASSKKLGSDIKTKSANSFEYTKSTAEKSVATATKQTQTTLADNFNTSTKSNGKTSNSSETTKYTSGSTVANKGCKYAPVCEFSTGVTVRVRNQELCMLSEQFPVEYEVFATSDIRDVVLTAKVSENASYLSSQPEAKVSGSDLTWNIGPMTKGQTLSGKIMLRAEKQGDICTCFNAKATAGACCSTMCAKAALACDKSGPDEVCPGDQFNYVVAVTNTGSYPAKDVVLVVTDQDKVNKPSNFNLGIIDAGKSKKVSIPVTAMKRGKICYSAVTTASNAEPVTADLCTLVTSYSLDCSKDGPKNAFIGQKAPYQIHIVNTGDRDLHDIVITETPHSATTIVAAEGASITDKKAVWKIPVLKSGEKANFKLTLTTRTTGSYANATAVTNKEGYNAARDTTTNWRGRAALDMSMSTSENSIFVGETTRYRITVTNQGQEPDSNVTIAAIFPEGLEPLNASGDSQATINGNTVHFAPKNLGLRQTVEHHVTVRATKAGDLRPKVQVSSDSIKLPITQEESLIVN